MHNIRGKDGIFIKTIFQKNQNFVQVLGLVKIFAKYFFDLSQFLRFFESFNFAWTILNPLHFLPNIPLFSYSAKE